MDTWIPGPVGRLEVLYRPGEGAPPASGPQAAVLCHPHPAHGGTMHNKVVYWIARGLAQLGLATLRFNYRGVGLSEGSYDEGQGEQDDIHAAIDWLAAREEGAPLLLAGFSFGARYGLAVGLRHPAVARLVGVGLAVRLLEGHALVGGTKPALFVHGDHDEFGGFADVEALVAGWNAPAELRVLRRCGHFFEGQLPQVAEVIRDRALADGLSGVHLS
ncbi:MAG: alpha/beta hydrolase [Deltaproteobacteria bacterium]|nr:alpha/beta hydrolase [Deltaproteobacteria bacterium]